MESWYPLDDRPAELASPLFFFFLLRFLFLLLLRLTLNSVLTWLLVRHTTLGSFVVSLVRHGLRGARGTHRKHFGGLWTSK